MLLDLVTFKLTLLIIVTHCVSFRPSMRQPGVSRVNLEAKEVDLRFFLCVRAKFQLV